MENITHAIESLTVWDCVYCVVAMGMLFVLNSKIEVKGPEGIGKVRAFMMEVFIRIIAISGGCLFALVIARGAMEAWNFAGTLF